MPRLFLGPREMDFFNDIAREVNKDIVGQTVRYYSINIAKTMVDELYHESPEKVFENPIVLDARVTWQPTEVTTNEFGHDEIRTLEVFVHVRDVITRGVRIMTGDYIAFGETFYEITAAVFADIVFGQPEYRMGYKMTCVQARQSEFITKIVGPTWEGYSDPDAVQDTFVQQRGLAHNREGLTGDEHDLVKRGVLDPPLTGQREISDRGGAGSAFYDETDGAT